MDNINDDLIPLGRKKKEDLYAAYKAVLAKHGKNARNMSRTSLYEEAAQSMAPQFYMSTFRAGIVINEMAKEEQHAGKQGRDTSGECPEVSGTV